MRTDKEFQKLLVDKIQFYRDSMPVFKIRNSNAKELHDESLRLVLPFTDAEQLKELRYDAKRNEAHTHLQLPENATLQYYHASGAKQFQKNTEAFSKLVSNNANEADVPGFKKMACDLLEKSKLNISTGSEQLKFERLWQLKATGISIEKKQTPVVINRLVYAYRRYINEIPVWGSASVFIKTAAQYEFEAFGIDWRKIHEDPITKASIISPDDAARMALEQLQNTNPEKIYTAKDFSPEFFSLGYFSLSKRTHQTILQPVYVAKFISKGTSKMGHTILVPAAGTAYETICRKMTAPPFNAPRILVSNNNPGTQPGNNNC